MRQTATLLVLLVLAGIAAAQPMTGTYTVKADGSGDFLNPYLAGEAVRTRGAVGPVTFDIYSGTYDLPSYVYLYQVPGADTCPITFQAATGQSVTVRYMSGYAFYGYGTDNVRIRNLKLITGSYAIYMSGCDNWQVTGNTIRSNNYCLYIYYNATWGACNNNLFERNDMRTTSSYGIYHYGSSTYRHQHNQFVNNMIYGWQSYGVYSYYNDGAVFYYNTFLGSGSYTFYAFYTAGDTWVNNCVVGFYPMYRATGTTNFPAASNYNCWYASSGSTQQFYNVTYGYQTLAQWQTNSGGLDMNSITSNPLTGGTNNPHLQSGSPCANVGTTITGITTDIDGDTRPTGSAPDMGADEFTSVGAAMSGTYYIKLGTYAADTFPSFEVANAQLAVRGQAGNITFEVFGGTYAEQVWIETPSQAPYSLTYIAHRTGGVKDDVTVMSGSTYGFYINGVKRVAIRDFNISGFNSYGIYVNNNASISPWRTSDSLTIAGNVISGPTPIYMFVANSNPGGPCDDSIYNNILNASSSYGIYVYGSPSYYTSRFYIFNNAISGFTSYGMYLSYMRGAKVLFNTVVGYGSASYALYASNCYFGNGGDSLQVKGNIFQNNYASTGAYAMYLTGGVQSPAAVNNNCLYVPNNSSLYVGYTSAYGGALNWASWQAAGFDLAGINTDPQVGGPLNFHLRTGSPCINAGPTGTGILTDVDGDSRTTNTPDIGFDEYTSVGSPMSGIFTIKQDGTGDFRSFPEAFGQVQLRGFGGNVQFDVYNGTYAGIPGASAAFNFEGIGNGANWLRVRGYPGQTVNLPCNGYTYGIRLYNNQRIALENLRIYGASSYGVYATSYYTNQNTTDTCVLRGNTITAPNPVYWSYGDDDSIIGNFLNASSSYGLYVYGYSGAPYSQRNVIANNMVQGWTSYGLYMYYQNGPKVIGNTIYGTGSYGFRDYYTRGLGAGMTNATVFKNNIFSGNSYGWYCYYHNGSSTGYPDTSDYNDIRTTSNSTTPIYTPGWGVISVPQWTTNTARDSHSINLDPLVVSATDLHLQATSPCKDVGTVVTGFAYDIDGDIRPIGSAADIGADEYFVDLGITAIVAPVGGVGVGSTVTPRVVLQHFGGPAGSNYVKMVLTNGGTPVYTESTLVATSPGDSVVVSLPDWVAGPVGSNFAVAAWHKQRPDAVPGNDSIGAGFQVGNVDVGVTAVLAPAASTPLGATVAPAVVVTNYGDFAANFDLAFTIDDGTLGGDALNAGTPRRKLHDATVYSQTVNVNLAYGQTDTVVFDTTWLASPAGDYTAEAQAAIIGDTDPGNDSIVLAVSVDRMDVGVSAVTAPIGNVARTNLYPSVKVMNYGEAAAVCAVRFVIRDAGNTVVYDRVQSGINVPMGDSAAFSFTTAWLPIAAGVYSHEATTQLMYDQDATNDSAFGTCTVADSGTVPTAWEPKASMPATPSGKMQKDGSWLVYSAFDGLIYAAKGYKVGDFYSYDPTSDAWTQLPDMPLGIETKGPYKGSIACTDGNGAIYATKGNNTPGFWKYTIADSAWTQLGDVPLGLSNKKVKGGTDMVYVQEDTTGWVYLLKGYRTEFYRYNTNLGTWETLLDAPTGVKNKYDKGSWLAYDGIGRTIYAHKAKYAEMYAYDLDSMAWGGLLPAMPLANQQTGKNKKSKDGGSAAYLNDGFIYALKGGNTCEFYSYDAGAQAWTERDTIDQLGPVGKKKRVKGGGDITSMNGEVLYAFKGNKSNELWKYSPAFAASIRPARSGVMAERVVPQGFDVKLGPNPLVTGVATLRYTLPAAGAATVKVVDVTGRTVLTRSLAANRLGSTQLDLRSLSAGVYLVKFASGDLTSSHKLVIR